VNSQTEVSWSRVVEVIPLEQHRLRVRTTDSRVMTLDLDCLIQRRDAYWRLRQDRYFRQVRLDPLGGICWPEGEDLAPEGLEQYIAR